MKLSRLSAKERIRQICDENSFIEIDSEIKNSNILNFPGYNEKIVKAKAVSGLNEAVVCGECKIHENAVYIFVMDSNFIMGSMGSVEGEKITALFDRATEKKLAVVGFIASGGARMQEGIFSLMQMAKVSGAIRKHSDAGLLYIPVLTDPTTGGVAASIGMLGDIILAEPSALIGFAGSRIIKYVTNEVLPDNFQDAEFMLQHGFIDAIIEREHLRSMLAKLLDIHKVR